MSTRCRIDFIVKWTDDAGKEHVERRCIYRHSDGYPEGVIPDLCEFLKWNAGRNGDVEYTAANFVYWSKRNFETYLKDGERWNDVNGNSISHIGFGVCAEDCWHGDLEYYYEVFAESNTVKIYKMPSKELIKTETLAILAKTPE